MTKHKTQITKKPLTAKQSKLGLLLKNNLRIFVLAIAVVAIVAGVIVKGHFQHNGFTPVPGQYHHSSALGMAATFPKGWNIDDQGSSSQLISTIYATDAANMQAATDASSFIIIFREPVKGSLQEASSIMFQQDTNDKNTGTKVLKDSDLSLGGLSAKSQETTSSNGHNLDIVTVDRNGIGYMITITTPQTKWPQMQPAIQTFIPCSSTSCLLIIEI